MRLKSPYHSIRGVFLISNTSWRWKRFYGPTRAPVSIVLRMYFLQHQPSTSNRQACWPSLTTAEWTNLHGVNFLVCNAQRSLGKKSWSILRKHGETKCGFRVKFLQSFRFYSTDLNKSGSDFRQTKALFPRLTELMIQWISGRNARKESTGDILNGLLYR